MKRLKLPILPAMQCDKGCGACCGPVPVSNAEYERISKFALERGILPRLQGSKCPLYIGGTCSVYAVRPVLCRAFGHTPKMPCAHGYNTNVDDGVIRKMVCREKRPRSLHELVGMTRDEAVAIALGEMGVMA